MGSGVLVDASSRVPGGGDWALAVSWRWQGQGYGKSNNNISSSSSVRGEGLEEVEELHSDREKNRCDSLLGTTDSRVDHSNTARPSAR